MVGALGPRHDLWPFESALLIDKSSIYYLEQTNIECILFTCCHSKPKV